MEGRERRGVARELAALLSTVTRSPYELFMDDTHFSFFQRNIKMQNRIKCGIDSSTSVTAELRKKPCQIVVTAINNARIICRSNWFLIGL